MTTEWRDPAAIAQWWDTPSQSSIQRSYTASDVAVLRDALPENVYANQMGLKLRSILAKNFTEKKAQVTYSPVDGIQLQKMAEMGLETAYISGGVTSMMSTSDPSTDHSDYTYDTIPNKVETLVRQQLLHFRLAAMRGDSDPEASLLPLIADADSGVNMYTTVMKLVKAFVRAGVAGFHIDDLLPGAKRYDGRDEEAYVCVPLSEYIRRLTAARLQLDIMGAETVIILRTDGNTATRITSTIDHRDRPFILGASIRQPTSYSDTSSRAAWKENARLTTIDKAFKEAQPNMYDQFEQDTRGLNVSAALEVAHQLAPAFYWSAEAARTPEGWYPFAGCIEASITRAIVGAPLADVVWSDSAYYNAREAEFFAMSMHKAWPGKWLGYNFTGGFADDGRRILKTLLMPEKVDAEVKLLPDKLANLGYVFQFMPLAGFTAAGLGADITAQAIKEDGVLGYLRSVSRPGSKLGPEGSAVEWWYKKMGRLTDKAADIVGTGQ